MLYLPLFDMKISNMYQRVLVTTFLYLAQQRSSGALMAMHTAAIKHYHSYDIYMRLPITIKDACVSINTHNPSNPQQNVPKPPPLQSCPFLPLKQDIPLILRSAFLKPGQFPLLCSDSEVYDLAQMQFPVRLWKLTVMRIKPSLQSSFGKRSAVSLWSCAHQKAGL